MQTRMCMMAAQCAQGMCFVELKLDQLYREHCFYSCPSKHYSMGTEHYSMGTEKIFSDVCVLMQSVAFYPCKDATENAGKATRPQLNGCALMLQY